MNLEKHIIEYEARLRRSRDEYILRRDRLVAQIEDAFRDVSREGGITLHEAGTIDDYGDREERERARSLDTDSHWTQVDVIHVDPGGSCLTFLDKVGLRYYIPAYMRATLQHAYESICDKPIDSNVYDSVVHALSRRRENDSAGFGLLDTTQSRCVARFLVLDLLLDPYDSNPESVGDSENYIALNAYWKNFLSPTEMKELREVWPKIF